MKPKKFFFFLFSFSRTSHDLKSAIKSMRVLFVPSDGSLLAGLCMQIEIHAKLPMKVLFTCLTFTSMRQCFLIRHKETCHHAFGRAPHHSLSSIHVSATTAIDGVLALINQCTIPSLAWHC